tara:strand:- start:130 stop:618 length:489 start_codon:yes stop_codon:yes gene_type:complete
MTSLYEMKNEYQEIQKMVEDGVPIEELQDTLDLMEDDIKEKGVNMLYLIRNIEGHLLAIKSEKERLSLKEKQYKASIDSIKKKMLSAMQETGIKKIGDSVIGASVRKGRQVCIIDDETKLPPEFVDIQVVTKPLKVDLLKALKEGDVEGAHIATGDDTLTIK